MRIDKLGAHLEAYIETLPTVLALRLCGRFGTGPQCHVNKLRVELISAIETFVIEPARVEALENWSSDYKCFELKCDRVDDHYTHEEQHEMYHRVTLTGCFGNNRCPFERKSGPETAKDTRKALMTYAEDLWFWEDSHDTKTRSWMKRVDMERPTCIFNEHRELARKQFGVDVWTSNVRLPPLSSTSVADEWKRPDTQNTSVAYMILPGNVSSHEDWLSGVYDHGHLQSGCAMPVKMGTVPTEESLRRFPRALNILGLNVFIHPTQKGTVISPPADVQPSGIADGVDGPAADWPQLTLLTRNRIREP